jgi:hypothetical protein
VSLCFTRLSAAVCEFLRVLWFSRFRPEVVSGNRGRGKPEVSHHSISRPHFCINGLLTSFVYLFPFKSYSTFSFRLEIPIGAEILVFFGNSRPLNACVHQRDPEKARPCAKPRRLSHHACLCDALFGRYAIARKKYKKKLLNAIKRKKSQSRYISRMRGGALIQPVTVEVCTSVEVTNLINRVNFCGCSLRGLVCAKGRI